MKAFYLWRASGQRPQDAAPVGIVKTAFDPFVAFYTPQEPKRVLIAASDDATQTALAGFEGGDLVFACVRESRGYRLDDVRITHIAKNKFEVTVIDGHPLRPLPDAFEWPLPQPPSPTEEELQAAREEELRREQRLIMSADTGMRPTRLVAGRRVRRQASTMTRAGGR
jgi:hypothetical protein